jgi:localization factor PodJL
MSAAAPWSVKGIDPKAREIAKDLARRSGLTLGDWLNRMIMEDLGEGGELSAEGAPMPIASGEFERLRDSIERLGERVETAEQRSALAVTGIDKTVLGLLSRLETAEREQVAVAARFEGALDEIKTDQSRTEARMAKVEEGSTQSRSIEALRALESALGKVAAHLYESESRTRESLTEMRSDLGGLTERVDRLDDADVAPSQVMIDGVVSRIVQRLEEAEARTSTAIKSLEASVSDFDQRLKVAETRDDGPEQRLEDLAAELLRNFDVAREDLAGKLEDAADARFEAMERSFREVTGQVQAAEQRSTQAVERVGREVLRVAEALGKRMEGVETRSAEAIEQVGGEVSRIADVMEGRLRKADQVQADSLERLGSEIARITERLADRIANAERRSAQAIDDVGEQVSRITERLNQRHERASTDLADRIRQSEERTARLLEEARDKIDQRLAGTERRLVEQVAPAVAAAPSPSTAPAAEPSSMFADPDLPPGPFARESGGLAAFRRGGGFVPLAEMSPPEPEKSPFEGDDFDPAELFESFGDESETAAASAEAEAPVAAAAPAPPPAPVVEAEFEDTFEAHAEPEPLPEPEPALSSRAASTRELIAQARAAARAAAQNGEPRAKSGGLFAGFGIGGGRPKSRAPSLKTGMTIAAAAAVLSIATAAGVFYKAQWVSHPRGHKATTTGLAIVPGQPTPGALTATPQAAVALAPQLTAPAPETGVDLAGLYADAVRRIEGKDNGGIVDLKRAAGLGYPPAEFYLAKLYEGGDAGLPKDVMQARTWTERAAQNGDRKAMHNLALYYFEGTGGPKNLAASAQWFQRAANLGLVDSQFNLARLYEGGFGVAQNAAEAYKWYLIAARAGDGESRAAADRMKGQLSADALSTAERAARGFRAETPDEPSTTLAVGSTTAGVALAQRALAKLGYYRGPSDGVLTPALKLAISSYQRDQGLTRTGALDPALIDRFSKAAG